MNKADRRIVDRLLREGKPTRDIAHLFNVTTQAIALHKKKLEAANLILPKTIEDPSPELEKLRQENMLEEKTAEKSQEAKAMAEDEKKDNKLPDCPECRRREFKIVDLEHELDTERKTNAELKAQALSLEDRPLEIPDLNTVIKHCESGECDAHKKQWDEIKSRIVQGTLDNLPDTVVESEGLKRGFIPKKIIIPVGR